jgi:mono/diheme cytochrome c family protein
VLYSKWCASCHGARGEGDGVNARYLPTRPAVHASAAAMSARSDDALFDVIAAGGSAAGKSPRMPAFGATLSPAEIRALVAHIRELCRCEGPTWSRDGSNR